jgi:hypothetical protein
MGQSLDSRRQLTETVRNILLTDWDPIRVQEFPEKFRLAAVGEYDDYIVKIIDMIGAKSERRAFERYLLDVETQTMGQRAENSRAAAAAQALFDLQAKFAGDP